MRSFRPPLILAFGLLTLGDVARGAGPADPLLRLVPPDAGVTLAIEDLRGHARAFGSSPLAEGLRGLPAVQAWLASDRFQGLRQARRQFEAILGETVSTIRDDLLGDAVVLALRLPAHARQEEARGLLLVRVRNAALLNRMIEGFNTAQKSKGELVRVIGRARGKTPYFVREFSVKSGRPPEYYAILEDRTFVMSNAEELVRGSIDRHSGTLRGIGDEPRFRRVRDRLPAHSVASLFVDPRFLEALLAPGPKPAKPSDERARAILAQYLEGVEFAGSALQWRDGVILHVEETIDPEKLAPWMKHRALETASGARPVEVPDSALAMASLRVDFPALESLLRAVTPATEHRKLDNLLEALRGVLLGQDVRSAILPRLGPQVVAYLEAPAESASPTLVTAVDLARRSGTVDVASALENALRTLLAVYALDAKHGDGALRLESRPLEGGTVTTLVPSSPFAFAVVPGRLWLARSAESVVRALAPPSRPSEVFARLRKAYIPEAQTYLVADLEALHRFADRHREALARQFAAKNQAPIESAARDLDKALALIALFRGAFVTSTLAPDMRSAHRELGLIARENPGDSRGR